MAEAGITPMLNALCARIANLEEEVKNLKDGRGRKTPPTTPPETRDASPETSRRYFPWLLHSRLFINVPEEQQMHSARVMPVPGPGVVMAQNPESPEGQQLVEAIEDEEEGRNCVAVFRDRRHPKLAVTFAHGNHRTIRENSKVPLYDFKNNPVGTVTAIYVSRLYDFILFCADEVKLRQEDSNPNLRWPTWKTIKSRMEYILLGYPQLGQRRMEQDPSAFKGVIQEPNDHDLLYISGSGAYPDLRDGLLYDINSPHISLIGIALISPTVPELANFQHGLGQAVTLQSATNPPLLWIIPLGILMEQGKVQEKLSQLLNKKRLAKEEEMPGGGPMSKQRKAGRQHQKSAHPSGSSASHYQPHSQQMHVEMEARDVLRSGEQCSSPSLILRGRSASASSYSLAAKELKRLQTNMLALRIRDMNVMESGEWENIAQADLDRGYPSMNEMTANEQTVFGQYQ